MRSVTNDEQLLFDDLRGELIKKLRKPVKKLLELDKLDGLLFGAKPETIRLPRGLQYFAESNAEPNIDELLTANAFPRIRQKILEVLQAEIDGFKIAHRDEDVKIYERARDEIETADKEKVQKTIELLIGDNPAHFLPFRYELDGEEFPGDAVDFECSPNTAFPYQPRTLLCKRYVCGKSGIYTALANSPNAPDRFVSRTYMLPVAEYEDLDGSGASVEIAYRIEGQSDWQSLIIKQAEMRSAAEITKILSDKRIDIRPKTAPLISEYLADILSQNRAFGLIETKKSASSLGWHSNEFTPYSESVTVTNTSDIVKSVRTSGDPAKITRFCEWWNDNKIFRTVCAASLAAPLVSWFRDLSFCVNLWGASGSGKTVLLKAAASIWGDPHEGGFLRSLNSTENAITGLFDSLNSLPAILDEGQALDRHVSPESLVYKICEGVQRGRADITGTPRPSKSWNTVAIMSGEKPLSGDRSAAGMLNRCLEIELAPGTFKPDICSSILDNVMDDYGFIGESFIGHIQNTPKAELQKEQRAMRDKLIAEGIEGKRAASVAWMATAERLASQKVFFNTEPLRFEDWLQIARSDVPVSTAERAKEFLIGWVSINESHFIQGESMPTALETYGRYSGRELAIIFDVLARTLYQNGFDFAQVRADWAEMNFLRTFDNNGNRTFKTQRNIFNSGKRPQCCVFNWID